MKLAKNPQCSVFSACSQNAFFSTQILGTFVFHCDECLKSVKGENNVSISRTLGNYFTFIWSLGLTFIFLNSCNSGDISQIQVVLRA